MKLIKYNGKVVTGIKCNVKMKAGNLFSEMKVRYEGEKSYQEISFQDYMDLTSGIVSGKYVEDDGK